MNAIHYYRTLRIGKSNPFISVWKTDNLSSGSTGSNQIELPLQGTQGVYDFVVDWGDGSRERLTAPNGIAGYTHTYASPGTYQIEIKGLCRGWTFSGSRDRLKILAIENWGDLRFNEMPSPGISAFNGCANLAVNATDVPNFEGVVEVSNFFRGCSSLSYIPRINEWGMSGKTNLSFFFFGTLFNQPLYNWDVSSNLNFNGMFTSTPFNQDITMWQVGNGTLFGGASSGMFMNTPFNQNIGIWDMSKAVNIREMLRNNNAFDQNIGGWNVSNITTAQNFMGGKTSFSPSNLDAIYNGWSSRSLKPGVAIHFGSLKYTAAGLAGRNTLISSPNNWIITDGGQL